MIQRDEPAPDIVRLTLDRPPVNALSPELLAALSEALESGVRDGARGIIVAGQPGMFSAGLDVPLLLKLDAAAMHDFWRGFFGVLRTFAGSPAPVGMAITGHCPAGGTVLALFADYRVGASGDFKLGLNEVQVGLPMPPLIFGAFKRLLGARAAEQLAVSARLVSPDEALALGLVDALAPPDRVVGETMARAKALAALPPAALAATRTLARADLLALFDGVTDSTYEEMNAVWFGTETQAAMRALVARLAERRVARGQGGA